KNNLIKGSFHRIEDACEVGIDGICPFLTAQFRNFLKNPHTGVGHYYIHPSKSIYGCSYGLLLRSQVTYIRREAQYFTVKSLTERCGCLLHSLLRSSCKYHGIPFVQQTFRYTVSYSFRSSCNKGCFHIYF